MIIHRIVYFLINNEYNLNFKNIFLSIIEIIAFDMFFYVKNF